MAIFAEFSVFQNRGMSADSAEVQAFVAGLGKMYIADERFKKNIDKYGEGTAEFVSAAIAVYCKN